MNKWYWLGWYLVYPNLQILCKYNKLYSKVDVEIFRDKSIIGHVVIRNDTYGDEGDRQWLELHHQPMEASIPKK